MASPYNGIAPDGWVEITRELIDAHPLSTQEIVDVALTSWNAIFASSLGPKGFRIGKHIFPKPQIMGFFLHELIALELAGRFPGVWRGEDGSTEKDLVSMPDRGFSVEVKTSSHKNKIFGNRSYAQKLKPGSRAKKAKSGYYLTVNFEKVERTNTSGQPRIRLVRFGWIDSSDWIGQKASTGQQSHLTPDADSSKLLVLYRQS